MTKKLSKDIRLPFAPPPGAQPFLDSHVLAAQTLPKVLTHATEKDVARVYAAPRVKSPNNAIGDPAANLQNFKLQDLEQFTKEKAFSSAASRDVHLFFVGRDDVHELLKYILSRASISLYLNMFGYDDDELNNIVMEKALDPSVAMMVTLDKSQAGGVHEKALIEADQKYNLAAFNTHFAIGESATHQISHTKGFVADGRVACEGSTNWSTSGEGTFVVKGQPGGKGYKAQNNTQSVITDLDTVTRFQTELIAEHMVVVAAAKASNSEARVSLPLTTTPATEALMRAKTARG
jgi:hypothetical protein